MNKYALRQTPLALAIGTLLAGGAVHAATITVTTNADGPLGSITEDCTLRAAIASANTGGAVDGCDSGTAGADEIVFEESLAESTITLGAGQMEITGPLTITGPVPGDAAGLVINGNQQSRIFRTVADLGLDSLTLTGGRTSTSGYGFRGGAIYAVNANLSLAHVMVTGNSTGGNYADGGGLHVFNGNATLINSTISGNSTTGNTAPGGGMHVAAGNVTLTQSTVSGNSTAGVIAHGGGMHVNGVNVTLTHSTVSGNSTAGDNAIGGGLSVFASGNVTLTHSTVSGNSTAGANAHGGGLSLSVTAATLTHSTVAYNTAAGGTDGVHQSGTATMTFNNSLIVQAGLGETACNQTAVSHTNTLATDTSCTGTATNLADIALGPLADNGGSTQTHALDADSVAIDGAGDCQQDFDVSDDQRGEPRPGFGSDACDIGAYEFQPLELVPMALDFGATRVAAAAGPLTMTVHNHSGHDLEFIGGGTITGPGAAVFAISADACTGMTLPPGGSCDVGIGFTPDDRMPFDAQVGFQFASGSVEAALTGTGIAPVMGLLPPTLDFGSVSLGQTGGPLSLEVINSGDDLLEVAALLGLVEPFSLASSGTCGAFPFTLPPGGQCTLDLQFTPTVVGGAKQAVFVSSDSFGGRQAFALRGLGFSIGDEIFEDRFEP